MILFRLPKELGLKTDIKPLNTSCFIYSVAVDLLSMPKSVYFSELTFMANKNNLNIEDRFDSCKALLLLIESIYKN